MGARASRLLSQIAKEGFFMRMSFPCLTAGLLLTAASPALSASAAADACNLPNSNQARINDCYGAAYKKSDAVLNELYREIHSRLKNDQATSKLLTSAEKAWLAFRDAECAFSTSGVSGAASIRPSRQSVWTTSPANASTI
jgi:uncharacterized protein YecT (DUF1311 family)